MDESLKTKLIVLLIVLLVALCLSTGYHAFKLKEKYNLVNNNNYTEAFSNLVNYINNVENYLAKAMITTSNEHAAETLTQIWRDSNLAMVYLSRIPLEDEGLSQTAKFLNQVSDYSYSLSRKNIDGQKLTNKDFENLKSLHDYSTDLELTLNQLSEELYNGTIDWDSLNVETVKLAQSVDNVSVFSNIDANLKEYEGLIYDGAYSDHVNKTEKVGLTGSDIKEDEAKEKVCNFIGNEEVEKIESNGFIENADIPSYDFTITLKDREVDEEIISQAEANEIGKAYLSDKGFKNMKETYFIKQGNVITVNYAYNDNGIIVYPDLIKVRIALDNGEILGIETTGYLNSHQDRVYKEPDISIEEVRAKLNSNIEIKSENMAIIPTEWKTEIQCYEFKGRVEGKDFLVYINTETGKEEDILVILDTPGGTLTV